MGRREEFRLSEYQDYGRLAKKDHIHLVRHKVTGKICVKKRLESMQKEVQEFRLSNPCKYFPKAYKMIEDEENVILIEEYVEGMNLEEYMMGEALEEERALKFAIQVAKGLKSLHDYQPMIIYRDLKPENIMITPEEKIKLIDFDIARKYQEGKLRDTELLGTVGYAAPEQFGYFQTDNRTDIFAFGLVFNYMLTGEFSAHHLTKGKYGKLIQTCVALDPADRYQTIDEVLRELLTEEQNAAAGVKGQTEEFDAEGIESHHNPAYAERSASHRNPGYAKERIWNPNSVLGDWIVPGFRTRTTWKMLLAGMIYLLVLWFGLTLEVTSEVPNAYVTVDLWLNRIAFLMSQFMTVFLVFNYRGISEKIPFYKSKSLVIKIASFVITWLICIFAAIIFLVMIEDILLL